MTVEREIAGFALPFAAGIFVTAYFGTHFYSDLPHIAASLTLISSALILAALMHPIRKRMSADAIKTLIYLLAAVTGAFTAISGEIFSISEAPGIIAKTAIGFGKRMQAAVDAIPFEDCGTNAMIKALITGDRSSLTPEITAGFRASGAAHILALSGLHLGIIYMIINRLLGISGNAPPARRIRSITIVLLCGWYTLATGAGASITRAFIFILLGETAKLTGRYRTTGSILLASLILQLAISPLSARDIGFQLSYAAMSGIAFILPVLQGFWKKSGRLWERPLYAIWNSAAMSIACQITTAPLAYLYFGTFPIYFLLTNLIAIPLAGIIIPAAVLTIVMNSCGICPQILIRATEMLMTALADALGIIADIS